MHRLTLNIRNSRRPQYAIAACLTALLIGLLSQVMTRVQASSIPTRMADSFVNSIGVATHLRYLDTAYTRYEDVIKPRLQELGVRHIRDGGKDLLMFQKMNDLAKLGIKSTLVMDPRDGIFPANVVSEVLNPTLSAVEAIEGPNEWDVQPQLNYQGQTFPGGIRAYQTDLYNAIKQNPATANLSVLMPSLAIPFNAPQLGYINELDAGNMHSYAGGNLPSQDLDTKWIPLTQVVSGNSKPIVATETGWHTAIADPAPSQPAISEQAAAKYIPRLFLEYFNRNVQRAFVYELIDERPVPNQENNFGLLRVDGTPKPAFTALKNLIALLTDPGTNFQPQTLSYQLTGNVANVHHTVLQKRDRRFYIALWQEVPSYNWQTKMDLAVPEQTVTLSLATAFKSAKAYQPINSVAPIWQQSNVTQLQVAVPDHPLIIELTPA
uniref:Calcium-binding protein n=1 Tax=Oscillatoriales cyanobacterium SpSt-402 TaxID=2282168 RepID=A0A832H1P6_9CYAN